MLRPPMLRLLILAAAAFGIPAAAIAAEGMPQLAFDNPMTISQIVWGALIFGLLYFLLSKSALPQVAEVLQARASRIESDLDTARLAKAEADHAVADSDQADRKARAEAQARVSEALAAAKAEAGAQAHEAEERLNQQLAAAEQRIDQARNAAMGALRQVATETASSLVARLTGKEPEGAALDSAVNDALAARKAA